MAILQRKIGIMGGTFDPIHIGHLVTAEAVRLAYGLDKVVFVPAGQPPHKQGSVVTPVKYRYIMTVMATYSNPYFFVSSFEMDRTGPSYTIETIKAFRELYGANTEFLFITGSDAVKDLYTWREVDKLLDLCQFVVATRPGCISEIDSVIQHFGAKGRETIHSFATVELDISSTDIRVRVKKGSSIKYLVPESVEKYIYKEGLYTK